MDPRDLESHFLMVSRRRLFITYPVLLGTVDKESSETEGAANLIRSGCHVIQLDVTKQKDIDKAAKKLDQILEEEGNYTFFFIRTPFFSPRLDVLIFSAI